MITKSTSTPQALSLISEMKRHGDVNLVTEKLEVSRAHVHNVLRGETEDQTVINAFLELINRRIKQAKKSEDLAAKIQNSRS